MKADTQSAAGWTHLLAAPKQSHIHLVGIGGAGLAPIARLLLQRGFAVSGSDQRAGPATDELAALGATVAIGHQAGHVAGADLALISSAIPATNPELLAAQATGIPVVKREQFLAPFMAGHQNICVAGSHGKTTTSAMIAALLDALGAEPSFIVGSVILALGTAGRAGRPCGPFVIEADEYDHMFLGLQPDLAVITNIEWDHVDCYPNPESYRHAFAQFAGLVSPGGVVLSCGDDPGCRALHENAGAQPQEPGRTPARWITYGLDDGNQWRATNVQPRLAATLDAGANGMEFDVWHAEKLMGRVAIPLAGEHNVRNALAALAITTLAGYDVFSKLRENLKLSRIFVGVKRRLEKIGVSHGIIVFDDYAHHPTEVRATLSAARQRFPRRPIWVLFQPHTYSRTRALLDEFRDSFENADHVLITDIYAAREHDTLGISALDVVQTLQGHPDARYAGDLDAATRLLLGGLKPGDILVTLGAGDGNRAGRQVLAGLQARPDLRVASSLAERYAALAAAIASDTGLALRRAEPLASHTTMRIGGPADLFVAVSTVDDLIAVLARAAELAVPALVLGGGSNLLVSDRGVRGLVVANGCRGVQRHQGDVLLAESGANLAGVARQAMRWGLAGLEWGVSVPGTVGGAVVGNAGAHGGCVADNLLRATLLDSDGALTEWPAARFAYGYRSSTLKSLLREDQTERAWPPVVLSAAFQLHEADPAQLEARAASFLAHRRNTQPVEPSAGSIFQNPPGDYAGRIIEALGLKGHSQGGAAFSTVHANFIVARGGASAADVAALINLARRTAWQTLGVTLTPEILFVGDWAEPPLAGLARSETGQSDVVGLARSETGQSDVVGLARSETGQSDVAGLARSETGQSDVVGLARSETGQSDVVGLARSETGQSDVAGLARSETGQSDVVGLARSETGQSDSGDEVMA
jgi:UDP-N-acetylmuramate--alanine ligase